MTIPHSFPIFSGKWFLLKISLKCLIPSFFYPFYQIKIRQRFFRKSSLELELNWMGCLVLTTDISLSWGLFFFFVFTPAPIGISQLPKQAMYNKLDNVLHLMLSLEEEHKHFLYYLMLVSLLEDRNQISLMPNWLSLEFKLKQVFLRILLQFVFIWFICAFVNSFLNGGSIGINLFGIVIPFPNNLSIPRLQRAETAPVASAGTAFEIAEVA